MKLYRLALLPLLSSLVLAQAAPRQAPSKPTPPSPPATKPAEAAKPLPPDAAVITIPGVCSQPPANPADCKLTVTRAQFEKILDALTTGRPNSQAVTPQLKRQFATQYARLLLFATEAEKQGLEKKPETQELIRFARQQALAQEFTHSLQEKAKPSAEEVRKYYDQNPAKFQELALQRIIVPAQPAPEEGKPAADVDMKKLAGELRQRAAAGGDFKALQAEAFQKAGMESPPETKLVIQSETVPESQSQILQLKPGEVSQPIESPGAFAIYKLDSRQPIPLDKVRPEIESTLTQEKFQQEIDSIISSAPQQLNDSYFGPASPAPSGAAPPPAPPKP